MKNTILIVDDVMLNIDLLTGILEDQYAIMAAVSGRNAIKIMERKMPDLVLLDVSMPDIDGFEVLKYMKASKALAATPVIFVTGEHDEQTEEQGLMLGAVDYIKKPYNASVVRIKVRNHLELKTYRDNLEWMVSERTKQLAASREAIIMGMSLMSESHDKVTGAHIERIKYITYILTRRLMETSPDMVSRDLADQVTLFSPLHDVGKVSIPDSILKKTGILTPDEFEVIKSHTWEGAALLRKTEHFLPDNDNAGSLAIATEIAECHHERFDGTGYPHGLKGQDIPLSARIVAIADVFDALRSPRPYKDAVSHERAMQIIFEGDRKTSPTHFDPMLLARFHEVQDEFVKIYEQF